MFKTMSQPKVLTMGRTGNSPALLIETSKLLLIVVSLLVCLSILLLPSVVEPQTAFGEIEGRPAPVSHRKCIGGTNAGALCNENADCPGSTCQDRNLVVFQIWI